jgi:hypothetical protein
VNGEFILLDAMPSTDRIAWPSPHPDIVVDCVAFFNKATFVTAESVRQTHGFF